MVGCSFQRWPSTSWSTFSMITVETRAKQLAKSCYIWSTATWCPWISKGAAWFHQLRGRSCAVPAGPIWEKQSSHGASSCKFGCDVWPVRWDAVFCFPMLRAIVTAVSLTTLGNIERPKMWNRRQLQILAKVTCKRSGNRLFFLYPLLSTPGALSMTPRVPMGPQTCWKSCVTLPWRSWTWSIAIKFRPLRGRSCAVPAGPIWEKQSSHGASSCKFDQICANLVAMFGQFG